MRSSSAPRVKITGIYLFIHFLYDASASFTSLNALRGKERPQRWNAATHLLTAERFTRHASRSWVRTAYAVLRQIPDSGLEGNSFPRQAAAFRRTPGPGFNKTLVSLAAEIIRECIHYENKRVRPGHPRRRGTKEAQDRFK